MPRGLQATFNSRLPFGLGKEMKHSCARMKKQKATKAPSPHSCACTLHVHCPILPKKQAISCSSDVVTLAPGIRFVLSVDLIRGMRKVRKKRTKRKNHESPLHIISSSMVASPAAGAAAAGASPLVAGAACAAALGSKYSLISASSSSTVLGLGRPARPDLRPPRPVFAAPPAAAAAAGLVAAADLGLLFSFFACLGALEEGLTSIRL